MAKHLLKVTFLWIGLLLLSHGCWSENPRMMKVETGQLSEISYTLAIISGNVLDVGESGLEAFGHCWSTSSSPSYDLDQKTQLGRCDTMGIYLSQLTGLLPDTKYFVRSYAKSGGNVVYGNEISFSSLGNAVPVVQTIEAFNIDYTSASCGGFVADDRGSTVIARGICWGDTPLPSLDGTYTSEPGSTFNFTSTLSPLIEGEGYYYRAYATNGFGTAYGDEKYFNTRLHPPEIYSIEEPVITSHKCLLKLQASGLYITQKGICYSTTPIPTIDGLQIPKGEMGGTFPVVLDELVSNTIYYIRPYVSNRDTTIYGEQIRVPTLPMVFNVNITPLRIYNGCPPDGSGEGTSDHEAYGPITAEIEGAPDSEISLRWPGIIDLDINKWKDIEEITGEDQLTDIDETQSIILFFSIGDEDTWSSASLLGSGQDTIPMSQILDLDNNAPTSAYSDTYTLPDTSGVIGNCLTMTFRFDFTEK